MGPIALLNTQDAGNSSDVLGEKRTTILIPFLFDAAE
jgi:hypothetical protein